ncbi:hypothetical protein Tco_1359466 [Tanacetum coccineum]
MHVAHISPHVSFVSGEVSTNLVLTVSRVRSLRKAVTQPAAPVVASGVPGDGSRMHTHDHDGSEAPDESPD